MKNKRLANIEKTGKYLNQSANIVLKITGSFIFAALTWYAFRYTQYISPGWEEKPVNTYDSFFTNLLFVLAALLVIASLFFLERKLSEKMRHTVSRAALITAMMWIGLWGLWWIRVVDRVPVGDQAHIYGGASYFLEGNYVFLAPGGYCWKCPHQLGQIALLELFFLVAGHFNYFAVQVLCTFLAVGIVYLGYRIIWETAQSMTGAVTYCIVMICCFPLIFYTSWVYGDVPGTLFGLLMAYSLIRYQKTERIKWLVCLIASSVLAILVRKNSMIFLVALALTVGISLLKKWDKKLFVATILSLILPFLIYQGIFKMYEIRSGYPKADGMPAASYIAMGMQEKNGKYGWYTLYAEQVFNDQQNNADLAAQVSRQDIKNRLREFKNNPAYAWQFYREKVLSQWNAPLYESLYFGDWYTEGKEPAYDSFAYKIGHNYFFRVLGLCDCMQSFIYLGMLCFFLFIIKKNDSLPGNLPAVIVIGGFFFCILWEAKSRYMFPYYIMMIPFAVKAYYQIVSSILSLGIKKGLLSRDKGEEQAGTKQEAA